MKTITYVGFVWFLLAAGLAFLPPALAGDKSGTGKTDKGGGEACAKGEACAGRNERPSREACTKEAIEAGLCKEKGGMSEPQRADREAMSAQFARDNEAAHAEQMRDKSHDNRVKIFERPSATGSVGVGGTPAGPNINVKVTFGHLAGNHVP